MICEATFSQKHSLKKHITNVHEKVIWNKNVDVKKHLQCTRNANVTCRFWFANMIVVASEFLKFPIRIVFRMIMQMALTFVRFHKWLEMRLPIDTWHKWVKLPQGNWPFQYKTKRKFERCHLSNPYPSLPKSNLFNAHTFRTQISYLSFPLSLLHLFANTQWWHLPVFRLVDLLAPLQCIESTGQKTGKSQICAI